MAKLEHQRQPSPAKQKRRHLAAFVVLIMTGLLPFLHASDQAPTGAFSSSSNRGGSQFHSLRSLVGVPQTFAAPAEPFAAREVARSNGVVKLNTGQSVTIWVEFQNVGTSSWRNSGPNFVALNVTDPAGRNSVFQQRFWRRSYRPAVLKEPTVDPGATGRFFIALKAPATAGTYSEAFQLVAENLTWISGSRIEIPIIVTLPPPAYQASLTVQTFDTLRLQPEQVSTILLAFQNTGSATWRNSEPNFVALNVTDPSGRESSFRNDSWKEFPYRPARLTQPTVRPGEVGQISLTLKAPKTPGAYSEAFQLVAENLTWISGSWFSLPIIVESNTPEQSSGEPIIDVGLTAVASSVVISADGPFSIYNGNNHVADQTAGAQVTFSFDQGQYRAQGAAFDQRSALPYQAVPQGTSILEVIDFENRPEWNTALNDNRFRGSAELQFSEVTKKLWLVNSLPLEHYLRGVAEASNDHPSEYLKALFTAARTYAHYHALTKTKHQDEHFTVDATNDQVYRGYNFELRSPNIAKAVQDTRGLEVTYNGNIVITPYFSQSDGRTRAWEEVWSGGPYPWLISKPDPGCQGRSLYGHGVGMSGCGALAMAKEGKTAEQILSYYYNATELKKQYE